ncbi:menaquinone biosynthesis decarboxylase [Helicobacter muridarum]|uniref:3-octaprenyl-4-hydroxybenzoate decarboxylase n=1 Tax=Helicobacter muridarum TaxID=216 RepID=A0A377PUQ5_9HELI|nr:menaquinone biosynthesis decarboxylase [Helicobacter muridarum]TLE01623.1 menaquinone biosynthesis decarboxylase [Helicobacter muridarum]STQ86240.1 3-octaprenyl-4-hydroxybenzoate decarboxylase [Helicobacter muridarum]
MQDLISFLQEHNELKIIEEPLDIWLEIPHLAYIEVKKQDSKALLFTNPIHKTKEGIITYNMPVVMNVFGSFRRLELLVTKYNTNKSFPNIESIASQIKSLLNLTPPKGIKNLFAKLFDLYALRHVFPKKYKGKAPCQEVIIQGDSINLYSLPILKTWEDDGGQFITMGQVYTQSLEDSKSKSAANNVGMYRLQVHSKDSLLLHWQIHKDGAHFFHEYKKANKLMPVSIAIGGDPLYIWCAQAPMPPRAFELMLYGLIRGKNPLLASCISNDLSVPYDCDIVIEGFVDTNEFAPEGKFGDHTGFYTPIDYYPIMRINAITMRQKPSFAATVVGKPPLEDKYMGFMTERLFLPLLQTSVHGLIDYSMPENGVFHNLILAKIETNYPAQSLQIMHSFFGLGQLSFVKHAIFLDSNAPSLHKDYETLCDYILQRVSTKELFITQGICDALDHATHEFGVSGKLAIDATKQPLKFSFQSIDSKGLLDKMKSISSEIESLHIYPHENPIVLCRVRKQKTPILSYANRFYDELNEYASFFIFIDSNEDLQNYYLLIWRIVNSIDVTRDLVIKDTCAFLDATSKGELENYTSDWPKDTLCTKQVLESLQEKGLLDGIDLEFIQKFGIL